MPHLSLYLEDADHGQVVADAALIGEAEVSATGFRVAVAAVRLCEEWQGQDACVLMGEGGGVGEDVVERGPFALVLIGALWELGCSVDEVVVLGEEFELWRMGFGIEIAHDDEVGVLPLCADRIRMCLELMADAHTLFFGLFAASFGGQMKHIDIERIASCNDACYMEEVACCTFACVGSNRMILNGMEGEGGVE